MFFEKIMFFVYIFDFFFMIFLEKFNNFLCNMFIGIKNLNNNKIISMNERMG